MRHAMHKPQIILLNCFAARLTEMNNLLTLYPGSDISKKMSSKDLNEILLHAIPNDWSEQSYRQRWDLEMKTCKETCAMLEILELSEHV